MNGNQERATDSRLNGGRVIGGRPTQTQQGVGETAKFRAELRQATDTVPRSDDPV